MNSTKPGPRRSLPGIPARKAASAAAAVAAAAAMLLAAVVAIPHATTPVSAADPDPLPLPPIASADAAIPLADLDPAVAAAYSGVARVDMGATCSGVLIDAGRDPRRTVATQPAYVLTNGHCIGFLDTNEVLRDLPGTGMVTFGWPGGPAELEVPVKAVVHATMKWTDVAIVEPDATLGALAAAGIRPYPLITERWGIGVSVVVVGAPYSVDGSPRQLVAATCTTGERPRLVEFRWTWDMPYSADCPDIRPGSSGSPMFVPERGGVIGVINTTTEGSGPVSDCAIGRPCEVLDRCGRLLSQPDTAYGASVGELYRCFHTSGHYVGPGGSCDLDPGVGLEITGATQVTNPDRPSPDGQPPRTTWGVELASPDGSLTHYATQVNPVGAVDCRRAGLYGPPVALTHAPRYDEPVPTDEGRYELCIIAGPGPVIDETWQDTRHATVSLLWIDRTPPIAPVELDVRDEPDAWFVEPVFVVPELSWFEWKWGPPGTTDCADDTGYRSYMRIPTRLSRDDAPTRLCVIGYDDANNPTPPFEQDFGT